jgi:diguanylate cyclase (GGDEF)-like protein/PAS domain S-box-containing protein
MFVQDDSGSLPDEDVPARLRVLRALDRLDAPAQESFDRFTRLVTRLLGVPVSLVSLVDNDRQFFLSQIGLSEPWSSMRETPLSHSFCKHVVADQLPLIVADARLDERLAGNLAIPDLGVVGYAGVPLLASGACVGSLCAIDSRPRDWSPDTVAVLEDLAEAVGSELELRLTQAALRDSEERFRMAFEAAAIGIVMVGVDGGKAGRVLRVNRAFREFLGRGDDSLVGMPLEDLWHPEDRDEARRAHQSLARAQPMGTVHVETRFRHADGRAVWGSSTTSLVTTAGVGSDYSMSMVEDITERKQAEIDLPSISNVLRRILSGEDPRETIVRAALDIAGASSAHLLELADARTLTVTASAGLDFTGLKVPLDGVSATAHSFQHGEALFLSDPAESPLVSAELLEMSRARSMMWQPIVDHRRVIGVLSVCWAERVRDMSSHAARAVSLLTDETAVALVHHDALERLSAQATTDGLTQLPNRRAWDERLAHEIAVARRSGSMLTLALLDFDHFKRFNDAHGHAAGDRLLCAFAQLAVKALREVDMLARWGGEEFAVLLPSCPSEAAALSVLDRIRSSVPYGQSCSAGFATWDGRETVGELMGRVDDALYLAKSRGRDRVVSAVGGVPS